MGFPKIEIEQWQDLLNRLQATGLAPWSKVGELPIYANNTTALAGGLVVGELYRTGADPDVVCVVH